MHTLQKTACLFAAAVFAVVCAGCDTAATNQSYPGPPLATLNGTMTAQQGLVINQPVRLAIAWFSYFSPATGPTSVPQGIETNDVAYTGTFPQSFSFAMTALPPSSSITTDPMGTRGAFGLVLAYEDLNGDGKLTVSSGDAPVVDRVLGASASYLFAPFAPVDGPWSYIIYFETLPAMAPPGSVVGYNLFTASPRAPGTPVAQSFSTGKLQLELVDEPLLNLFACNDFYKSVAEVSPTNPKPCGIDRTTQSKDMVVAQIGFTEPGGAAATVFLGDVGSIEPEPGAQDAGVTINNHPMEYSNNRFVYVEQTPTVLLNTANTLRVSRPGKPLWEGTGIPPLPFTVTSPTAAKVNSTFTVSWVPGVGDHSVFSVATVDGQYPTPVNNSVTVKAPASAGPMMIMVNAVPDTFLADKVKTSRTVTKTVTIEP